MTDTPNEIRDDWRRRQQQHGNAPRAVLMKGLHPELNQLIDTWHRDVLRIMLAKIATRVRNPVVLDVGCGYGRLANEVSSAGLAPVGIDFTPGFCEAFADTHGMAVCGDQRALPFAAGSFAAVYLVTSLMYLDSDAISKAIAETDRCLETNGLVLVLEPSLEFNEMVRYMLPHKRRETLAMAGFSVADFNSMLPSSWEPVAAGHCRWLTLLLPLLALTIRWQQIHRFIARLARRLDRPRLNGRHAHGRISLYRWIICRKLG